MLRRQQEWHSVQQWHMCTCGIVAASWRCSSRCPYSTNVGLSITRTVLRNEGLTWSGAWAWLVLVESIRVEVRVRVRVRVSVGRKHTRGSLSKRAHGVTRCVSQWIQNS
jgi:hypothetical protein